MFLTCCYGRTCRTTHKLPSILSRSKIYNKRKRVTVETNFIVLMPRSSRGRFDMAAASTSENFVREKCERFQLWKKNKGDWGDCDSCKLLAAAFSG